ncbi:MAG: aldehyde ferredoxin oxidoreductase family protein [Desulfobacteraceae bacterium]|nr:aldehyde ferredoxin oxidoreductase family protein [Desulfobacteraceae bacterium]
MGVGTQFGRLLKVDLNSGQCTLSAFPESCAQYLGGRGFNAWYLYQHLPKGVDPLGPDNILLISCGLLTGSSAPACARLHINSLSPLTGILGSSNIGGYTGAWLRSCNISSIIITGKAKHPVALYIDDKGARLGDASILWGKDAFETQDAIRYAHKEGKPKILAIGQAGENRVRFAAIMTEKDHAAGRTGMGAVMGSKNLKAIVVSKGSHKHFFAKSIVQKQAVKDYALAIKNAAEFGFFSRYGGAGYVNWVNDMGIMGSKNYQDIGVDQIEKIDGRQLEKNVIKKTGCFKCPIQCKADLKIKQQGQDKIFTRPEFEPVINFGPKCGLDDLGAIIRLDNLCGRLGLDTTSSAGAIAFAMDLFEKGLMPERWSQGLDLSWGNAETMERLIYQMVEGKGLGKILRLGVRQAAKSIGKEAQKYAMHVKGLELTAYHPAAIMGTALGYAVSSRGGDYNNVYASLEYSWTKEEAKKEFGTKEAVNIKAIKAKGRLVAKAVTTNILVDCLGLCKVPVLSLLKSFNLEHEIRLANSLTDLKLTKVDLFESAIKIAALERLFNLRHSKERLEDKLPDTFMGNVGDKVLTTEDFNNMLKAFYRAIGWDENGIPLKIAQP